MSKSAMRQEQPLSLECDLLQTTKRQGSSEVWRFLAAHFPVCDQAFQMRHQPFGLTGPTTDLQSFGAINKRQFAQFWFPFGELR